MEEQFEGLRKAQAKKSVLADQRAMELQMKHPQLAGHDPELKPVVRGGGEAGLARVAGAGRKRAPKIVAGALAPPQDVPPVMAGGAKQGSALAAHLMKMYGGAFVQDFMDGMKGAAPAMEAAKPKRGGARMVGAGEIAQAKMSSVAYGLPGSAAGGQDVPLGGIAPIAQGNPPQAPESFRRNTVGMGRAGAGMCGAGAAGAGMAGASNGKIAKSARGQMIAKLMREKGMSLGEASKYLKANPSG